MPLAEADIITLIFNECGGNITLGDRPEVQVTLDPNIQWQNNDMFAGQIRLRQAQTKLDCIRYLLGQCRYLTNAGIQDLNPQLGMRISNLQAMEQDAIQDVANWKQYYASQRLNVIQPICAKAPIEPRPFQPDPNSRRLRGDALERPFFSE